VLEQKFGIPQVINDGVSIARAIELADPVENAGAQLVKEVRGVGGWGGYCWDVLVVWEKGAATCNNALSRRWAAPTTQQHNNTTTQQHINTTTQQHNQQLTIDNPQVAGRTNDSAGDGTTTAACLAREMIHFGLQCVTAGANPIAVKKGIDKTAEFLVGKLRENAKPVQGRNDIRVGCACCVGVWGCVGCVWGVCVCGGGGEGRRLWGFSAPREADVSARCALEQGVQTERSQSSSSSSSPSCHPNLIHPPLTPPHPPQPHTPTERRLHLGRQRRLCG